ncbi:hypothetical protein [Streptomyces sp. NPDC006668]|uniref:hypothetical protein n=1 Tax=Streptomyces sp. NPDC006668 TaxID=3156903 RepID=UPI0033DACC1F
MPENTSSEAKSPVATTSTDVVARPATRLDAREAVAGTQERSSSSSFQISSARSSISASTARRRRAVIRHPRTGSRSGRSLISTAPRQGIANKV